MEKPKTFFEEIGDDVNGILGRMVCRSLLQHRASVAGGFPELTIVTPVVGGAKYEMGAIYGADPADDNGYSLSSVSVDKCNADGKQREDLGGVSFMGDGEIDAGFTYGTEIPLRAAVTDLVATGRLLPLAN